MDQETSRPNSLLIPGIRFIQIINILLMILILYWDVFYIFNPGSGGVSSAMLTLAYWAGLLILTGIMYILRTGVVNDEIILNLSTIYLVLAIIGIPSNYFAIDDIAVISDRLMTAIINGSIPMITSILNFYFIRK